MPAAKKKTAAVAADSANSNLSLLRCVTGIAKFAALTAIAKGIFSQYPQFVLADRAILFIVAVVIAPTKTATSSAGDAAAMITGESLHHNEFPKHNDKLSIEHKFIQVNMDLGRNWLELGLFGGDNMGRQKE